MSTSTILCFLLFTRSIFTRRSVATYRATPAQPDEDHQKQPAAKNGTLAGVPLWLLESERSHPGAVLRDSLMIRPSGHDH
jgi:hypothetical protein